MRAAVLLKVHLLATLNTIGQIGQQLGQSLFPICRSIVGVREIGKMCSRCPRSLQSRSCKAWSTFHAGRILQQLLQPPDGAQVSHAGRRFGQPQRFGDFRVRELFVVSHDDDFTVLLAQSPQRLLHQSGHFLPRRGGCRGQFGIANLGHQVIGRPIGRGGNGQRSAHDRHSVSPSHDGVGARR